MPRETELKTDKTTGLMVPEMRYLPMAEMRTEKTEDGEMIVEGYAIVYNQEANIWGDIEVIMPGASTEALKKRDQFYLWQHDTAYPLARKSLGTLTATEDEKGVFIHAEIIDTQDGRDSFVKIEARLVDKQSFAFDVEKVRWEENVVDDRTVWKRFIEKFAEIYEFSAVTFPAYEDTSLESRCRDLAFRDKPKPEASEEAGAAALEVRRDASENLRLMRGVHNG